MPDMLTSLLASVVICLVIALVAWRVVRSKPGDSSLNERRLMQAGDWINAVVNLLLGVLLGIVMNGLAQLFASGMWPVAVFILFVFVALWLSNAFFDGLIEKLLPSGLRAAREPQRKGRKPLLQLLSLPLGLIIGFVLAWLGLGRVFLDAFL